MLLTGHCTTQLPPKTPSYHRPQGLLVPSRGIHGLQWAQRNLYLLSSEQLPDGLQMRFPAVNTEQFARAVAVVSLLQSTTLGKSSTALQDDILELHSKEWSCQYLCYLSTSGHHRRRHQSLNFEVVEHLMYQHAPHFPLTVVFSFRGKRCLGGTSTA